MKIVGRNSVMQANTISIMHILTRSDGRSEFVDRSLCIAHGASPPLTHSISHGKGAFFRILLRNAAAEFHNASSRQFMIAHEGRLYMEPTCGTSRMIKAGEIMFIEDTEGDGHLTRVDEPGVALFVPVAPDFDLSRWISEHS